MDSYDKTLVWLGLSILMLIGGIAALVITINSNDTRWDISTWFLVVAFMLRYESDHGWQKVEDDE